MCDDCSTPSIASAFEFECDSARSPVEVDAASGESVAYDEDVVCSGGMDGGSAAAFRCRAQGASPSPVCPASPDADASSEFALCCAFDAVTEYPGSCNS